MAFETVKGQKVFSSATGTTYIFGDYFVVFRSDSSVPEIYEWKSVSSVTENRGNISISAGMSTYSIESSAFSSEEQFLTVRAIIEGHIAENPDIRYKFNQRILPLKYLYRNIDASNAYVMHGVYEEKVINSSNISLVSARFGRVIFVFAVLLMAIFFMIIAGIMGNIQDNWIYCLPLSVFFGIIVSVVVYLIIGAVARHKYSSVQKADPATTQEITVVVAPEGFAAVESSVYTAHDLIPWNEANFFIETHMGLVVLRDNKSVFWLPKSFMPKNQQAGIYNLIASKVKQR